MIRGLIRFVIVGVVLMAVIAVFALGPRRLEGILPPAAIEALDRVAAVVPYAATGIRAGDTPADFLDDGPDGLAAAGPIAAAAGNTPVFLADVIAGYSTAVAGQIPAEITTIRPIMGCLLTPPLDGSVVGYATAGESGLPLGLTTYNDVDLATGVQDFVDSYRATGATEAVVPPGLAYQAYDVAVTETAAPVYLVLENLDGNRIWNIHLAPGARIERVVLLGGDQAGVASLDPVVPVEVLLRDGLEACGIAPAHPLNAGHAFFAAAAAGEITAADAVAQQDARAAAVEAYARWLRDSFGLDRQARAGFDVGTLSVIGPTPAAEEGKAVYAGLAGSRMRLTQDSFFEIEGQVPSGEDFAARVKAIATSFAFGDLATLRQGADF